MKIYVAVLGLIPILFAGSGAKADLLNFDFSFTSNPADSTVNGTVTGEIIGLQSNGTSTPVDIILTSIPAGFGLNSPSSYSLAANGWHLSGDAQGPAFTVVNGVITSGTDYEATLPSQNGLLDFNLPLPVPGQGVELLNGFQYGADGGEYAANTAGFPGVAFTPASVPEPASWGLGISALLMLIALRRNRLCPSAVK